MIFKNLILYILSVVSKLIFFTIGTIYGLIFNPKGTSEKLFEMAQSNDRSIGVYCTELFNKTLLTKDTKNPFGDGRFTISHYLGVNKLANTLSNEGIKWANLLHKIDPNHVIKAIGWKNNKINQK